MSFGHKDASEESQDMCDELVAALIRRGTAFVPVARQERTRCAIDWGMGGGVLAYVGHEKRGPCIEVWFNGAPTEIPGKTKLDVRVRGTTEGPFVENYPLWLKLCRESDADEAVRVISLGFAHKTRR